MTHMAEMMAGQGTTGEALLESMRAVQQALRQPHGLSADQFVARIQEWQQGIMELVGRCAYGLELATLYEIMGVLNSSLDLTETLGMVMDALIHLTGAERGCLMLLDEEGGLAVRAAQNFDQKVVDAFDLQLSQTAIRDTVERAQPVLTTNAQIDPRFSDQESVVGYHLRSIVCVPLHLRAKVIGALYLDNRMRDNVFSESDLPILIAFANQAAVAIENARLYTTTDQALAARVKELTALQHQLQLYTTELERSNEEVKQFAYIVSHDLRAPLVNMKGFASELRLALNEIQSVIDDVWPHLTEQQRQTLTYVLHEDAPEALQFIDSSANHMDNFIAALLKLSRLGRRELEREPVDVEHVVQNILPTLAHQIAAHQGKVTIAPLPQVIADRTSIEQIMGNILGNAVKYLTPDRPARIEITAERNANETIFHIRDNGRGIAPGDMDKVFTPFRRAGIQDVPGEGMGLAYVQTLVRRHSGRIWCESELGAGSTFSIALPNHHGADDPAAPTGE